MGTVLDDYGFGEDMLVTALTQAIQSTEVLHILIPCNSATHKVITAGESGDVQGRWMQREIRTSRQPRRVAQLDKLQTSLYALKSLLTAIFSMPKHRRQISKLLMGKKKLHVSNGRQTLRSRLTSLLLQQNLVHGDQLHCPLPFLKLTTNLQAGGFVRLPRWAFGTHVRSALMLYQKRPNARPGWRMP